MAKSREVKEIQIIRGKKLECPVCAGKKFWSRETLMNTAGMSFFNLDWANKGATNYICNSCGYVYWFLDK